MIRITNEDNMKLMARYEDNYFDLAIVDPPYGIGIDGDIRIRKPDRPSTWDKEDKYTQKEWDKNRPSADYWKELFRVSKNQIVLGGNYFTDYLPISKSWVFWDKLFDKTFNFSHGELAWTSFDKQLLKVTKSSKAETNGGKDRIHPTQKPSYIYKFLLDNFAKQGDKILDTHLGSGSIAIACNDYGFDLIACEIDTEYFDKAMKRLKIAQSQTKLF